MDTEISVDQHRKLTLEKKIPPLLLQGFEPVTFVIGGGGGGGRGVMGLRERFNTGYFC